MLDIEAALHGHHFPDVVIDVGAPEFPLCWRRASTFCKAPLKNCTSRIFSASSCLTCCSSSCRLISSGRLWGLGLPRLLSGCRGFFLQRYSCTRCTPRRLAKTPMG